MCKSQPTDDKLSLIGAWSGHVTHLKFLGSSHITGTAELNLKSSNCVNSSNINSNNRMTYHPGMVMVT